MLFPACGNRPNKGGNAYERKLILIFSLADLCEMLHAADSSEEPEILLHQELDDVLTTMLR